MSKQKRTSFFRPFFTLSCPQGIVCYTVFYFRVVNKWCFCSRKSDVISFAHNDVAPDGRNDVMLAHYDIRRNIIYAVNIIAKGVITCPLGQTSFGWPALSQVTAIGVFLLWWCKLNENRSVIFQSRPWRVYHSLFTWISRKKRAYHQCEALHRRSQARYSVAPLLTSLRSFNTR